MNCLFDFKLLLKINFLNNKKFLISYSGGLDSTVLLYHLKNFKQFNKDFVFRVIHINHNINNLSKEWSHHCYQQCKKWNFDLIIVNLKKDIIYIYKKSLGGIESSARFLRHKIYNMYLLNDEILLLGHHLQDKVETFFLNLKRGCGPKGLSSLNQKSKLGKLTIFRPMLNISKISIYSFALSKNLNWIEDYSNQDIYYDRNYIRQKILPNLRKKWPYIDRAINKTSFLCSIQEDLLKESLLKEIKFLIDVKRSSLNFLPLLNMPDIKKYYFLRVWLNEIKPSITPSYKCLSHILKNVIYAKIDRNPILRINKFEIRRFKKFIYIVNFISKDVLKNLKIRCYYPWKDLELPYKLGYLVEVDKYSIFGTPILKPCNHEHMFIKFAVNPKVCLINRKKKCFLNKFYKEISIPSWLRYRIPLLFYDNNLIAAPNIFVCRDIYRINDIKEDLNKKIYFYLRWLAPKKF